MANNQPQESGSNSGGGGLGDEFFEQILSVGRYNSAVTDPSGGGGGGSGVGYVGPSDGLLLGYGPSQDGFNVGIGGFRTDMGLGLNFDHALGVGPSSRSTLGGGLGCGPPHASSSRINEHESVHLSNLFPAFGQMQPQGMRPMPSSIQLHQAFQTQDAPPPPQMVSQPPSMRPRVRARRGQATDPHSIAERLRRERIAERMKALQELVPSCNKTDRAAMLDEIVDYVKFLRLQVKVLSMSRLGGASAVAQLVADVPPSSVEGDGVEGAELAWEKWSSDGTEQHVAKLMEQDIGAAMQFLQSKALCIMPISLASAIFRSQPPPSDPPATIKPELDPPPEFSNSPF